VLLATPYRPLTTLDTVATETPAAKATSWMVTRRAVFTAKPYRVENVIDND
jgi:hypothetical protein